MGQPLTIALDGMGGDRAPEIVIEGADVARVRYPGLRFLIVGDESRLNALLVQYPKLATVASVSHTDEVISAEDRPSVALRQGRRSSMRMAIDAVARGEALGVVSAGNTGALMAMSKLALKTMSGVHRPALATIIPTRRGESVFLDLGANIDCTAENLVQFAVLGEVFARTVLGIVKPTVGLLNVGIETNKGNEIVRAAATVLQSGQVPLEYHGFVEGDAIFTGTVDVVVTDGFTGNVALKTAEGTVQLYNEFLRTAIKQSRIAQLGYLLARHALTVLRDRVDPRRYNGAVFLGLNAVAVKSHGATDALGFATAIGFAVDMATQGYNEKVIDELGQWHADKAAEAAAV